MAGLATICGAFENAVFERLHVQTLATPENGGASCPAENAIQSAFPESGRASADIGLRPRDLRKQMTEATI